ncbi:HAD hydrolase-like protein [Bacillus sp. NPDC094106]|uniref:HAD hydrolase-like protein n=1 Tax=Bacillus sp. NPDC094106 TaxID=3363949 RepID=UPI00382D51C4
MRECYVVGDTGSSDMIAAEKAGAKKILVKTGWGESSLTKYRSAWQGIVPQYIADNLLDTVNGIAKDTKYP